MNSLGLQNGELYIENLFDGCLKDGLYLLEAEDKVEPGCVNWKKVQLAAEAHGQVSAGGAAAE